MSDFIYNENEYKVQIDAGDLITAKKVKKGDFPKGTPVMVRDKSSEGWILRYFVEFGDDGRIGAVQAPYNCITLPWQQWRPCTDEEFPYPIYNWRSCPDERPEWLEDECRVTVMFSAGNTREGFTTSSGVMVESVHYTYDCIKFIAKL